MTHFFYLLFHRFCYLYSKLLPQYLQLLLCTMLILKQYIHQILKACILCVILPFRIQHEDMHHTIILYLLLPSISQVFFFHAVMIRYSFFPICIFLHQPYRMYPLYLLIFFLAYDQSTAIVFRSL